MGFRVDLLDEGVAGVRPLHIYVVFTPSFVQGSGFRVQARDLGSGSKVDLLNEGVAGVRLYEEVSGV